MKIGVGGLSVWVEAGSREPVDRAELKILARVVTIRV